MSDHEFEPAFERFDFHTTGPRLASASTRTSDLKGYYKTLGLDPSATGEDIKAAYRWLAKKFHPDRDSSPRGVALFQSIAEAYSVLGNQARKASYDNSGVINLPVVVTEDAKQTITSSQDVGRPLPELRVEKPLATKPVRVGYLVRYLALTAVGAAGGLAIVVVFGIAVFRSIPIFPGQTFSDCGGCPIMVVVPSGEFVMGIPVQPQSTEQASPPHLVTIATSIAVGKFEVTNVQYVEFLTAMGRTGRFDQRWVNTEREDNGSHLRFREGFGIVQSGFEAHPVTGVSWPGAKAYVDWLSERTGYAYRLLTEAEWEYAARAGTQTKFHFGGDDQILQICEYANIPDYTWYQSHPDWAVLRCTDGYSETAPVGKFKPNSFGIYDTIGNAWEWVEDCWHDRYQGAPTDGSAWISGGDCTQRVVRGGSFDDVNISSGVADRRYFAANARLKSIGFRVAREIKP